LSAVSAIDAVVALVVRHGAEEDDARGIATYIADRCAGLSLASVHSSGHSSLKRDAFLVRQCRLSPRQVSAWLALIRGTRAVRRNGRTYGGCPGVVESILIGTLEPERWARYDRLARVAATGRLQPSVSAFGRA